MAAIDKTYIKSYAQYREIADWCKAQGTVTDSFGNKITPYNYIPHNWEYKDDDDFEGVDKGEYTEEQINEWTKDDGEIVLWNTDHIFDIYLIKNCPVQFIQDRLKEQYGGGWSKESFTSHSDSYEAIKNGTSVYDTYQRNGIKKPHFKINYLSNQPFKDDNIRWWIEVIVDGNMWMYDRVSDYWFSDEECYMTKSDCWTATSYGDYKGNMNYHRIGRILDKWNLPEGAMVKFIGDYNRYHMKSFNVIVKK